MTDKQSEQPAPPQLQSLEYYAAVLHATGLYSVETFATVEALTERLRELTDQDVSVFCFAGAQLKISKMPFRHLITPWGAFKLFDIPPESELEEDETGYLGFDPIHLENAPEVNVKSKSAPPMGDEFFTDPAASDDLFTDILPDPDS